MAKEQVIVGEYENELDAEIAKGHLEASGIHASIIKDDGGGMLPSLQNADGVGLVVAENQRKRKRREYFRQNLIAKIKRSPNIILLVYETSWTRLGMRRKKSRL